MPEEEDSQIVDKIGFLMSELTRLMDNVDNPDQVRDKTMANNRVDLSNGESNYYENTINLGNAENTSCDEIINFDTISGQDLEVKIKAKNLEEQTERRRKEIEDEKRWVLPENLARD